MNMSEEAEEEPAITSDYPPPPSYYLNYGPGGSPLHPPPIPENGIYSVFGEERRLDEQTPTLESQGLKTLYDTTGRPKEELKKLVRGSKKRFVSLVQLLSKNGEQEEIHKQFEDLDMCLINMLYLVNEMRTKQAKAELREMLKAQITAKQQAISYLNATILSAKTQVEEVFARASEVSNQDAIMDEPE